MLKKIFFLFLLQVSLIGNMFAMKSSQIEDSDSEAGDTIIIRDEGTMIVHEEESVSKDVDLKEYKPVVYGNKGRGRRDSNSNKMMLREFIKLMNENENGSIEEDDNKKEQLLKELEELGNQYNSGATLNREEAKRAINIWGTLTLKRKQNKECSEGQTDKTETPCSILEELENDYASQPKQSFLGWVYSFLPEMPENKDVVLEDHFPDDEEDNEQPAQSWLGWAFSWVGLNPDQTSK